MSDDILSRYVAPHRKVAREVGPDDIHRVGRDAQIMAELCETPRGFYKGTFTVAHSQIDDKTRFASSS